MVEVDSMAYSKQFRRNQSAGSSVATLGEYCSWVPLFLIVFSTGCAGRHQAVRTERPTEAVEAISLAESTDTVSVRADESDSPVLLVSYSENTVSDNGSDASSTQVSRPRKTSSRTSRETSTSLSELETLASASNPVVRRLEQEVQAAWAKAGYVDKLPDPTVGANVYVNPIETAAGSQRANLSFMQMIPSLERLDARAQQACYDAMSVQEALRAERLKVLAEVRIAWYQLFVLGRQIEINTANQSQLKQLIEIANARIATGAASEGDVKLGSLELSRLYERLVTLRQQVESTKAELNRAVGRDADYPVRIPDQLDVSLPDWSHATLRQLADEHQPAIVAAHLRTHATRWGIEVARLERRPNVTLNASWFLIDDNRPTSGVVSVGQDAYSLGAQVSVPIWQGKYEAMENEANWKHSASHASTDELRNRYDALLRDLWEQAQAASETRRLYTETLLPQARETRDVDVQSFSNGSVEFDRVIRDFLNVLTLEEGQHRATGQLATALARIEQAVGTETTPTPLPVPTVSPVE